MFKKKAFTLLEVVIVVVIISVLASLALPRLVNMIEYSRSSEALAILGAIRASMERCYLMHGGSYAECKPEQYVVGGDPYGLDIIPENDPNQHFYYTIPSALKSTYTLRTRRNAHEFSGTNPLSNEIFCYQLVDRYYCQGTGIYSKLRIGNPP